VAALAVMGAGSWGTTFASTCADAGEPDVRLWCRSAEVADQVGGSHRNREYLGDAPLNRAITATTDPEQALAGAEIVVLAVPSHALRDCLLAWRDHVPRTAIAVSLVKGIAVDTHQRASQVIRDVWDLPSGHVVVLSGPNLARECIARQPSATVVAGPETRVTARVQVACHTPWLRVYTNPDLIGVEVGGAVKNPIAIAAGMADGLGYGDNTRAALLTRGLAEMTRLGLALGSNPLTFSGLAGVGDLVATCSSRQSRNRHVGLELGRGRSLADVQAGMHMVAEGVRSSQAVLDIARRAGVEMPIVEQVVEVVHGGAAPEEVVARLMGRAPKPEFHGFDLGDEQDGASP
jgi:glycerol-3-phosphate dehydrogenase (NAD(P)+)